MGADGPAGVAALAVVLSKRVGFGLDGWRFLLCVPVLGALLIWKVRRGLPESPRWLAEHGRGAEASMILKRVEGLVEHRSGRPLPEPAATDAGAFEVREGGFHELFRGELGRRVLVMIAASCTATFAYFGFNNWLPTLLEARGVGLTKSLGYSALIAISFPLAPLLFSLFADRLERKWQIVLGAAITAAAGLAFVAQRAALGWIVCGLVISVAANLLSYGLHTYRSELFPTRLRGRAIGMVYSVDRLSAALNSYIIGFLLVTFGVAGVLVGVTAAAVVSLTIIALFGPRTRGLTADGLEHLQLIAS